MSVRTALQRSIRPSPTRSTAALWAKSLLEAIVLFLGSLGAALYAVAITVVARLAVVHVEEPELRARFGETYAEYCRTTSRWLPRLRRAKGCARTGARPDDAG